MTVPWPIGVLGLLGVLAALLACPHPSPQHGLTRSQCWSIPRPPSTALDHHGVIAGRYDICFCATSGSRKGHCVMATLWLATPSDSDRSPRTGKLADDRRQRGLLLFGALERFDPRAIGAPIHIARGPGANRAHPIAPNSRDPVYPGVLVSKGEVKDVSNRPVPGVHLTIATPGNARDGSTWLDGSGIVLLVRQIDRTGFAGVWGASGVVTDGSGVFHARRRHTAAE